MVVFLVAEAVELLLVLLAAAVAEGVAEAAAVALAEADADGVAALVVAGAEVVVAAPVSGEAAAGKPVLAVVD